jgi:hypothetical protein
MSVDLQALSNEFDQFCYERYKAGEEEYGPIAFFKNPVIQMAAEELADIVNYARFAYIKLRTMEEALLEHGIDLSAELVVQTRENNEVSHGSASFVPSKEILGFLPDQESQG